MKTKRFTAMAAMAVAAMLSVGCSHDDGGSSMQGGSSASGKPLEGNPHATTGPSAGYPQSDANGYHPLTDDTKTPNGASQYRPADPNSVQPNH